MKILATWSKNDGEIVLTHYNCGGKVFAEYGTSGGRFLICNSCQKNKAFNLFGQLVIQAMTIKMPEEKRTVH